MKKGTASILFLLIASAATSFLLWRQNSALHANNQALLAQIADLQNSAEVTAMANNSSDTLRAELQGQKRELLRLRDEVTQLRTSRDAATRVENELARLRASRDSSRAALESAPQDGQNIPRDSWQFAGYESPQTAFLSGLWAMKEGKLETMLNSFTAEERDRVQQQMNLNSDADVAQRFEKQYGRVTGVRVLAQHEATAGEVVLDVYLDGLGAMKKYRMNQVGNEWKAGAPINQNASRAVAANSDPATDPLAFYRRNPELMKRYFPHLFNAQQPQALELESAQTQETPPRFDPQQ